MQAINLKGLRHVVGMKTAVQLDDLKKAAQQEQLATDETKTRKKKLASRKRDVDSRINDVLRLDLSKNVES